MTQAFCHFVVETWVTEKFGDFSRLTQLGRPSIQTPRARHQRPPPTWTLELVTLLYQQCCCPGCGCMTLPFAKSRPRRPQSCKNVQLLCRKSSMVTQYSSKNNAERSIRSSGAAGGTSRPPLGCVLAAMPWLFSHLPTAGERRWPCRFAPWALWLWAFRSPGCVRPRSTAASNAGKHP